MIIIAHHRASVEQLRQQYPGAPILDVTSRGPEPWQRFSPFYPHGDIPVPFSPSWVSASVEGIWQGLKVFVQADIDLSCLTNTTMKRLKRSTRSYGSVLGHREGIDGTRLLSYAEARRAIYLPSYHWVLTNKLQKPLTEIQKLALAQGVVLLDYETNCDLNNLATPLSHAGLIKRYLEGDWPADTERKLNS